MNWWQLILVLVKYGPSVWKLITEIIKMIDEIADLIPQSEGKSFKYWQKRYLAKNFGHYKSTKDRKRLESQHGELYVQLENLRDGLV